MLKLLQFLPILSRMWKWFEDWWEERQKAKYKAEGNLEGRAEAKAEAQTQVKEEIKEVKTIETEMSQKSDEDINAILTKGFKR
jgi:hypothetical protein